MGNERQIVHHHHPRAFASPWDDMFGRSFGMLGAPDLMPVPFYGASPARFIDDVIRDFGIERQLSEVTNTDDKFAVKLDVSQFKPEELEVTTKANEVTITGHHEERRDDHGFVSRKFTRRYTLPEGTKAENIVSGLSKDGFLTIEAPKALEGGARKIPITHK